MEMIPYPSHLPKTGDGHPNIDAQAANDGPFCQNLDTSPLTPALMRNNQLAQLSRCLPTGRSFYLLSRILGDNLTPDTLSFPSSYPKVLNHISLRPYWKFFKFLIITYFSMWVSREFAKRWGSTWDESLNIDTFVEHNFWDTITDSTLIYLVGRLHYRRGVDCANFLVPLFFGACVWELIGTHPELSKNLSCIDCWTSLTWVVFVGFMLIILAILILHVIKMQNDELLPGRAFEIVAIIGLTLGPLVGNDDFHLHHWCWAWLGALVFNLRYPWSFATQGFMVGMYANGIGIWGRDPVLPA